MQKKKVADKSKRRRVLELVKLAEKRYRQLDVTKDLEYTECMEDVEAYYRDALRIDPTSYEANYGLAKFISAETTAHDLAVEFYAVASKSDPANTEFWDDYCRSLRYINKPKEALKAIERALALDPKDDNLVRSKICCLLKADRREDADPLIATILAKSKDKDQIGDLLSLRILGRVHDGEYADALADAKVLAKSYKKQVEHAADVVKELQACMTKKSARAAARKKIDDWCYWSYI
jgi:Tfp pilus assembly protein PilF